MLHLIKPKNMSLLNAQKRKKHKKEWKIVWQVGLQRLIDYNRLID